jgi:hypothetical protein
MFIQLNPYIPVIIKSKENAKGYAFALHDYSQEHHCIWGVALDDSGEVWWVPNPEIRFQDNWSMGR